jgi:hypothetical protein
MTLITSVLAAKGELDIGRTKYTIVSPFLHAKIDKIHYEEQPEPR